MAVQAPFYCERETDREHEARILRYFATQGLIVETAEDTFTANALTKTLSIPGFKAGIKHK